jgi:predicted ATPase with chaperone activity
VLTQATNSKVSDRTQAALSATSAPERRLNPVSDGICRDNRPSTNTTQLFVSTIEDGAVPLNQDSSTKAEATPEYVPLAPSTLAEAGLREAQVEALVLKFLLNAGGHTGRKIANQVGLAFGVVQPLLDQLKAVQLVAYKSSAMFGDFEYELTPNGAERARFHAGQSAYFGSAPVPLLEYTKSVEAQSCRRYKPRLEAVKHAFSSLVLSDSATVRLGEALHLGLGLFLYGAPGNGKTTIAEMLTNIYGEGIWIPRCIDTGGEIVRVFDPTQHKELPWNKEFAINERRVDGRWVHIKRPTIVVGGELRLDKLEVSMNDFTGISEAPIQVKSNCGTFVIDDFGRQKFEIAALLNRLIIPLERRLDVLNLPSGRSFVVPFDQMIVFATNLPPESLVDEAFLRRVPFAIQVEDPSEDQFRELFRQEAERSSLSCGVEEVDHLLDTHYRRPNRPIRFCHARDLVRQISNSCEFLGRPRTITRENIDAAVQNCLSIHLHVDEFVPVLPRSKPR